MSEPELLSQARIFLPKYLSPEEQKDLWSELRAFPSNGAYYTTAPVFEGKLLQGDGWRGFVAIDFDSAQRRTVSGLVLSNSCDIDASNARVLPPNVLFAPLVRLDAYAAMLRAAGKPEAFVAEQCETIRTQRITNIFYLQGSGESMPERIAILDDIHRQPLKHFLGCERNCLFTLNQFAFYLFLLKLSIHFTRMQEGISRTPSGAAALAASSEAVAPSAPGGGAELT